MLEHFNLNLINKNDVLVLSISGGVDSMVLLDIFLKFKDSYHLSLHVAHIDHQKRESSSEDANFVKQVAEKNNLPFYLYELDNHTNDNFHDYAHQERYDFLVRVARQCKANKIVLAHHLDDLAETIMMRLVRGSSFEGYQGILEKINYKGFDIIRPLLNIDKDTISKYQENNQILYREDESNLKDDYTRNRYRHQLMPFLKEENPKFLEKIKQFSNYQSMSYQLINDLSSQYIRSLDFSKDFVLIDINEFNQLHEIIQIDSIKKIINHLTDNQLELSFTNLKDIIYLSKQDKAHISFEIPNQIYVDKSYDKILFRTYKNQLNNFNLEINDFGQYKINNEYQVYISKKLDKNYDYIYKLCYNILDLVFPLTIRNRQSGDRLDIHVGTKKLKDFFIDKKIPLELRDQLPLLVDHKNEILFIPGLYQKNTEGLEKIYIHFKKIKY